MKIQLPGDSLGPAIAFLLFGVACGLALDLCAKALLADYSLEQFVFLRSIVGLLFFLLVARWYGGLSSLKSALWPWHLLRTFLATGSMFGFFYGLMYMPLVNALTLAFTAPLIVTALSVPLLGEHVGWRRWLAVIIGFAGVLIILRPGTGLFNFAAIAVLGSAVCYAGLAITARKLAATESSFALSVYVLIGPLMASTLTIRENYATPDASGWLLFVMAGLCSAGAWIGVVGGYRRAPPALLAPLEYTALIGAAAAGYWIWNEVPDRWVVAGALTIIGSGLFIVHREIGEALATRYLRVFTVIADAIIARRHGRYTD
ncbi:MAG: DMT family transporter [Gammaproteobacteria bacterium]|nr:DMT family transporter [Gammaproteobacteria bacterium]